MPFSQCFCCENLKIPTLTVSWGREEGGLDRTLLLGTVYGPGGRGRPKTRFMDGSTKYYGGINAIVKQAKDKRVWRRFVKEALAIRNRGNLS